MVSMRKLGAVLWLSLTLSVSGCLQTVECDSDADCPEGLQCLKSGTGYVVASVCGVRDNVSDMVDAPVCEEDTQSDPNHCGACGNVCADSLGPNVVPLCESGGCVARECQSGFMSLADPAGPDFAAVGCPVDFDANDADVATLTLTDVVGVARGAQTTLIVDQESAGLRLHAVVDSTSPPAVDGETTLDGVTSVNEVSGSHVGTFGRGVAAIAAASGTSSVVAFDNQGNIEVVDTLELTGVDAGAARVAVDVTTALKDDTGSAFDVFWTTKSKVVWFAYFKVGDTVPYAGATCETLSTTFIAAERCLVAEEDITNAGGVRLIPRDTDRFYLALSTFDGSTSLLTERRLDLGKGELVPSTTLVPDDHPTEAVQDMQPWYEEDGASASGVVVLGEDGEVSFFRMVLGPQLVEGRAREKQLFQASGLSATPRSLVYFGAGRYLVLGDDGLFMVSGHPGEDEPLTASTRAQWRYGAEHNGLRAMVRDKQILRYDSNL